MDFLFNRELLEEISSRPNKDWSIHANQFIELLPEPTVILDEEGIMCFANSIFYDKIAKLGRLKQRDFIQMIIHVDRREEVIKCLEEMLEGNLLTRRFRTLKTVKTHLYRSNTSYVYRVPQNGEKEPHILNKDYSVYDWTFSCGHGFVLATAREPTHNISSSSPTKHSLDNNDQASQLSPLPSTPQPSSSSSQPVVASSSSMLKKLVELKDKQYYSFIKPIDVYSQYCLSYLNMMIYRVESSEDLLLDAQMTSKKVVGACTDASLMCNRKKVEMYEEEDINIDQIMENIMHLYYQENLPESLTYNLEFFPQISAEKIAAFGVRTRKVVLERLVYNLIDCINHYWSREGDIGIRAIMDSESLNTKSEYKKVNDECLLKVTIDSPTRKLMDSTEKKRL